MMGTCGSVRTGRGLQRKLRPTTVQPAGLPPVQHLRTQGKPGQGGGVRRVLASPMKILGYSSSSSSVSPLGRWVTTVFLRSMYSGAAYLRTSAAHVSCAAHTSRALLPRLLSRNQLKPRSS